MLIGTTFAWFTDSVTSANNIIKSGNLDVELQYSTDMTTWTNVDATTNVFKENTLWEPGHTEVVYLRVMNVGSLALKYQLGIHVASETIGTNQKDEDIQLSKYLEYDVIEPVTALYADRDTARGAVTNPMKLSETFLKDTNNTSYFVEVNL
jgi:predicted ribosomally synthesized peptide with SipW-like signal peptide